MKQDIKISLPIYKIVYSITFITLLPFLRGISQVSDIGVVMDGNMAFLAIIFCADTYYQEFEGNRWEIICLKPLQKRIIVVLRRLWIQFIYLILLSMAGYQIFYVQKIMETTQDEKHNLFFISLSAIAVSIVIFGTLSMTIVNITKNLWAGIGITVIIWLIINSTLGQKLPKYLNVFAFSSRYFDSSVGNLWIGGKITALVLASVLLLLVKPILNKKGKRC